MQKGRPGPPAEPWSLSILLDPFDTASRLVETKTCLMVSQFKHTSPMSPIVAADSRRRVRPMVEDIREGRRKPLVTRAFCCVSGGVNQNAAAMRRRATAATKGGGAVHVHQCVITVGPRRRSRAFVIGFGTVDQFRNLSSG